MVEQAAQFFERVHTEHVVLDIGQEIGALVIYTSENFRGKEIEVSLKEDNGQRIHTAILERRVNGRVVFAGVFLALHEGDYTIWCVPPREVTITGGGVAEVDLCAGAYLPGAAHPHDHGAFWSAAQACAAMNILPPRYRDGKVVSAAPMGAAPMRYADDGQIAWNEMWTGFCDLALAGGPPHRDSLLEPVTPDEVNADRAAYERVVAEIERGLQMVTGLSTVRSEKAGWVGLNCEDEQMALWLLRAIVVENVCVRREGRVLFLPAGPAFRLEKEIKNVITVVAKTHHYWMEHLHAAAFSF